MVSVQFLLLLLAGKGDLRGKSEGRKKENKKRKERPGESQTRPIACVGSHLVGIEHNDIVAALLNGRVVKGLVLALQYGGNDAGQTPHAMAGRVNHKPQPLAVDRVLREA